MCADLQDYVLIPYNVTMGLFALYAAFAVAYQYAEAEKADTLSAGVLSLINFFCLTPYVNDIGGVLFAQGGYAYSCDWLGCKGLFIAIIVAVITAKIFCLFESKGWVIRLPDGVPPYVEKSFASLIPGTIMAFVCMIIAWAFAQTSFGFVHQLIYTYLQTSLTVIGGSLPGYLFSQALIQLLWWFGIHGFNVVAGIIMPIFLSVDAACMAGETMNPIGMSLMTVVGQSSVPVVLILLFYFVFVSGIVTPLSGAQVSMQVPVIIYGLIQGNWMVALWQALAIPLAMILHLPFYRTYDNKLLKEEKEREQLQA